MTKKARDEQHKPAEHIEEAAKLASAIEADKSPANVLENRSGRPQPPPEEDLGGGDICSLEQHPSTDDDKPFD